MDSRTRLWTLGSIETKQKYVGWRTKHPQSAFATWPSEVLSENRWTFLHNWKKLKRYFKMHSRVGLKSKLCFAKPAQNLLERKSARNASSQRSGLWIKFWCKKRAFTISKRKIRCVKMYSANGLSFTLFSTITAQDQVDRRNVYETPSQLFRL